MPVNIVMPQMGESIAEGTVVKWMKQIGDAVEKDEPVLEISTDKVDTEVPAPAAGTLANIVVEEGATVEVGVTLGVIAAAGESVTAAPTPEAEAPAPEAASPPPEGGNGAPTGADAAPPAAPAPAPAESAAGGNGSGSTSPAPAETGTPRFYSPLVQSIAAREGIPFDELERVPGTGREGRVTKKDLLAYVAQRAAAPAAGAGVPPAPVPAPPALPAAPAIQWTGEEQREPMGVMRRKIAEHMIASRRTSAHVTSISEADMTGIVAFRERQKAAFEAREGFKLTYTPFIATAVVEALKSFPYVNASIDGEEIVLKRSIHLGMAVDLGDGLIVPVVRSADEKNFLGLARGINDLAGRARSKKLKPEEVQGGTFTITNPGVFGGLIGTPIINQPQVAILGVGAIQKRPVVVTQHGVDAITIRSMMFASLSYDHRLVDGAMGTQFLQRVCDTLTHFDFNGLF